MVQQRDPSDQLANEAKRSKMLGFCSFLSELLSMQPHGGACTHGPELVHRRESFICSFPPSDRLSDNQRVPRMVLRSAGGF